MVWQVRVLNIFTTSKNTVTVFLVILLIVTVFLAILLFLSGFDKIILIHFNFLQHMTKISTYKIDIYTHFLLKTMVVLLLIV